MRYHVAVPPQVEMSVKHLHPGLKKKIKEALKLLEENPHTGKPLQGKLAGLMSFRATYYRIVYRVVLRKKWIEIVDIGPRKTIYERFFGWKLS